MATAKKIESLENWRKSQEWSQSDLAEKLGWSQKKVSRIETGSSISPEDEEALRKLGYGGPVSKGSQSLAEIMDEIEEAVQQLAQRGIKPPTKEAAHTLRRLVAEALEAGRGSQEPLADRVERWVKAAEAIRK